MIRTPYFLVDERRLVQNLDVVRRVREESGAKSVLALKCFSTWSVFGVMRPYLDGTTSSSLYEARLGREEFGGEVHAYSVAFTAEEVAAVSRIADKVIFNSLSQLDRFGAGVVGPEVGLRINPGDQPLGVRPRRPGSAALPPRRRRRRRPAGRRARGWTA